MPLRGTWKHRRTGPFQPAVLAHPTSTRKEESRHESHPFTKVSSEHIKNLDGKRHPRVLKGPADKLGVRAVETCSEKTLWTER